MSADPTTTSRTEIHREILASVYAGERSSKAAIAFAREQGYFVSKRWAAMCRNADYLAGVHRQFAPTTKKDER